MKLRKFYFKKVKSTNDCAIKTIEKTNNKSGMIVSESQSKGRGQYGKKWVSYKGNLFVSIFFPINNNKLSSRQLTIINCFLVRILLNNFYNGKIMIKKPNDLVVNKKKISGILQEILYKKNERFMIVGIGINLIKSPNIKNYPTTNLVALTKKKINYNKVILLLKKIYEKYIPIFSELNIKNMNKI